MKKIFIILSLTLCIFAFGQIKFELNPITGINTTTIIPIKDKKSSDLYKATYKWILKNYKNPDNVIVAKIENEFIKIKGYASELYNVGSRKKNVIYILEFSFKDGKFKTDISEMKFETGIIDLPTMDVRTESRFFYKNGELTSEGNETAQLLTSYFNEINEGIINTVNGKNNDW
ncbi:DUF4468 domain-containing protein [Elizabethkingia anophelis]|nr:DUF4468 domain-containing protein [Elizabethkingia anophelis]MCT4156302.1 DUF4468 domain-containing protein [Elizabethkingia anophelis]MCT4170626.1 DUF4468 domain-containing protein [Elizabethkingia anophelis]MCT4245042.1 DUF4468 domain-containing protein [Elizabethkingia anophelis]MCT4248837.1 DUF4468 domain-containing protein [Elizabethkingia anophelis]